MFQRKKKRFNRDEVIPSKAIISNCCPKQANIRLDFVF